MLWAMPVRLIAIDVDGTLLNSAKQITALTAAALHAAREAHGVKVVLASARPPRSVRGFYESLRLDTPTINYNGALVYEPPSQRVLLHRPLPEAVARAAVELARRLAPDVLVSAEVLDHWYTDRVDPAYATETARLFAPDVVGPLDRWLNQEITKLLFLGPQAVMEEISAAMNRHLAYQVSVVQTEENLLQVMHPTVGKAAALRTVAAHLHTQREDVLAIGDNANDIGMLQWASHSVAMGNAPQAVKAVAQHVTDSHDEDGAAKAIRRFVFSP